MPLKKRGVLMKTIKEWIRAIKEDERHELIKRVQEQLEHNWAVSKEDIQEILNIIKEDEKRR